MTNRKSTRKANPLAPLQLVLGILLIMPVSLVLILARGFGNKALEVMAGLGTLATGVYLIIRGVAAVRLVRAEKLAAEASLRPRTVEHPGVAVRSQAVPAKPRVLAPEALAWRGRGGDTYVSSGRWTLGGAATALAVGLGTAIVLGAAVGMWLDIVFPSLHWKFIGNLRVLLILPIVFGPLITFRAVLLGGRMGHVRSPAVVGIIRPLCCLGNVCFGLAFFASLRGHCSPFDIAPVLAFLTSDVMLAIAVVPLVAAGLMTAGIGGAMFARGLPPYCEACEVWMNRSLREPLAPVKNPEVLAASLEAGDYTILNQLVLVDATAPRFRAIAFSRTA